MTSNILGWLVAILVLGQAWSSPTLYRDPDSRLMSDIQRLASRAPRLQDSLGADPRLSLLSIQDLEAIKKVAQILVMLGEQVIPSIIGENPPAHSTTGGALVEDAPIDPVNEN